MNIANKSCRFVALAIALALAVACSKPIQPPREIANVITTPTLESSVAGLTDEQIATLRSVERVDDYPLYTMRYGGSYEAVLSQPEQVADSIQWSCSLFAAMGDPNGRLYGRNFDWSYSPTALVFTHPADGYASASMVDLSYLFLPGPVPSLTELPLADRKPLLQAPLLPFDGMNDRGLAVGMAAVPDRATPRDPAKRTIGSLRVIREMLDHARNVDEAVGIISSYNIDMQGGPTIHYLIADATGRAALVEFLQEKMAVIPNDASWHLATNFLRGDVDGNGTGNCSRYDRIYQRLDESGGQLATQDALDLLNDVSQTSTQWSIVYEMSTGSITVAMGREYGKQHTFQLDRARP